VRAEIFIQVKEPACATPTMAKESDKLLVRAEIFNHVKEPECATPTTANSTINLTLSLAQNFNSLFGANGVVQTARYELKRPFSN
jgi:hypothetical protein